MLEIILIIFLSRKVGNIAKKRGHKARPNIIFFVVLWFAGELIGALLGSILSKGNIIATYFMALIGAAVGAYIAYNIIQNLEDKSGSDSDIITIDGD